MTTKAPEHSATVTSAAAAGVTLQAVQHISDAWSAYRQFQYALVLGLSTVCQVIQQLSNTAVHAIPDMHIRLDKMTGVQASLQTQVQEKTGSYNSVRLTMRT